MRLPLTLVLPAIATLIVLTLYVPLVWHLGYVWDDWQLIVQNPSLRLGVDFLNTISNPILPGTTYFRPLVLTTYYLEFVFFENPVRVSHIINILLHALNTLLVFQISRTLSRTVKLCDEKLSLIKASVVALFYGLHPALIEPICWISGRFDLLVTSFLLIAIFAFITQTGGVRIITTSLAFLMAAFCKEMAATLPLILLCFSLVNQNKTIRSIISEKEEQKIFISIITAGLIYISIKLFITDSFIHVDKNTASHLVSPEIYGAFVGKTIIFYLKMVCFPFSNINPQHPFTPSDITTSDLIFGNLSVFMALLYGILSIITRNRFLILSYSAFIALFPVLNILPLTIGGNIGHDRFLTFPLALFAISLSQLEIASSVLSPIAKMVFPVLLTILGGGWIFVAMLNIWITVPLWKSDFSLWTWAYNRNSTVPYIQFSYIASALRYNQYELAQSALEKHKDNPSPYFSILKSQLLIRTGHPEEGTTLLEETISKIHPPHLVISGKDGMSLTNFTVKKSNSLKWLYEFIYTALAEGYNAQRKFDDANKAADTALFYSPSYPAATLAKAFSLYGLNDWDSGDKFYEKAISQFPSYSVSEVNTLKHQFINQLCNANLSKPTSCK